jgi:hypothetical protein
MTEKELVDKINAYYVRWSEGRIDIYGKIALEKLEKQLKEIRNK